MLMSAASELNCKYTFFKWKVDNDGNIVFEMYSIVFTLNSNPIMKTNYALMMYTNVGIFHRKHAIMVIWK